MKMTIMRMKINHQIVMIKVVTEMMVIVEMGIQIIMVKIARVLFLH
jgi:hypothetical protein